MYACCKESRREAEARYALVGAVEDGENAYVLPREDCVDCKSCLDCGMSCLSFFRMSSKEGLYFRLVWKHTFNTQTYRYTHSLTHSHSHTHSHIHTPTLTLTLTQTHAHNKHIQHNTRAYAQIHYDSTQHKQTQHTRESDTHPRTQVLTPAHTPTAYRFTGSFAQHSVAIVHSKSGCLYLVGRSKRLPDATKLMTCMLRMSP